MLIGTHTNTHTIHIPSMCQIHRKLCMSTIMHYWFPTSSYYFFYRSHPSGYKEKKNCCLSVYSTKAQVPTLSSEFNEHLNFLQQVVKVLFLWNEILVEIEQKYSTMVLSLRFAVNYVWIFTLPIAARWPWRN